MFPRLRPPRVMLAALALFASATAGAQLPLTVDASPASHHRDTRGPVVIAHRGASGYLPEHTLAAYRLAIVQGADFIEPDLVATRDGVLVARHENEISATTDVAERPEFADRRTTKRVDGVRLTGWFTEDFTLAELRILRAKERIPEVRPRNARFDGRFRIPTFAEVVRLAKRMSRPGREVGVYPETKHPTYFAHEGRRIDGQPIGVSLGGALVRTLVEEDFVDPRRVFIQSFEVQNLLELRQSIMPAAGVELPLVQLYGALESGQPYDFAYNAMHGHDPGAVYGGLGDRIEGGITGDTRFGQLATAPVLEWMHGHYATGIGPSRSDLLPRVPVDPVDVDGDGRALLDSRNTGAVHPLLPRALDAGLLVHPYTLRAEEPFLTRTAQGIGQGVLAEAVQLYGLGAHGFFIDQPDLGVAARDIFLDLNRPLPRGR